MLMLIIAVFLTLCAIFLAWTNLLHPSSFDEKFAAVLVIIGAVLTWTLV